VYKLYKHIEISSTLGSLGSLCVLFPVQVVNLRYSELQDRVMLTGRHMVRDVACKNCNCKLGWVYEFAVEEGQRSVLLYLSIYKHSIVDQYYDANTE